MKQQTNRTLVACVVVFIGGAALAEDRTTGAIKPLSSVKFSPDNDVKCLQSAIESGDPTTGRSTLIFINGAVLAEMADHRPTRLGPGGFAIMGSRMPHQFTCQGKSACLMVVA